MSLPKNIALVHDWLVNMRGGEKVLEILCELFPDAALFTLVHRKGKLSSSIERMKIKTSFIQNMPFGESHYQHYLPLFPSAVRRFDLQEFDLVISSSHAAAKGVSVRDGALHICYCHTPMRYIWDQYENYFGVGRASIITRLGMNLCRGYLQRWDAKTASGVHHFVANSRNVQERIKRIYQRESEVIYPPVDVQRFSLSKNDERYFLILSALVPYKRIDIAVDAFNKLDERLVIVGTGSEEKNLKACASKNIEFVGWVDDAELQRYYAGCRALIFPGEEDFGIVPVEAMACGKPVIAYGKGGQLETVIDSVTGVLFSEQTAENLQRAVYKMKGIRFDPEVIRAHALQFDKLLFRERINQFIDDKWNQHCAARKSFRS